MHALLADIPQRIPRKGIFVRVATQISPHSVGRQSQEIVEVAEKGTFDLVDDHDASSFVPGQMPRRSPVPAFFSQSRSGVPGRSPSAAQVAALRRQRLAVLS
jgi:hypothetical protein